MSRRRGIVTLTAALAMVAGVAAPRAQAPSTLSPQDYIAILQLVSKYAYAIDECTNRGYDYADESRNPAYRFFLR